MKGLTIVTLIRYLMFLGFITSMIWMINSPKDSADRCQYKVLKDSLIEVTSCKLKLPETELEKYIWLDDQKGSQHNYN